MPLCSRNFAVRAHVLQLQISCAEENRPPGSGRRGRIIPATRCATATRCTPAAKRTTCSDTMPRSLPAWMATSAAMVASRSHDARPRSHAASAGQSPGVCGKEQTQKPIQNVTPSKKKNKHSNRTTAGATKRKRQARAVRPPSGIVKGRKRPVKGPRQISVSAKGHETREHWEDTMQSEIGACSPASTESMLNTQRSASKVLLEDVSSGGETTTQHAAFEAASSASPSAMRQSCSSQGGDGGETPANIPSGGDATQSPGYTVPKTANDSSVPSLNSSGLSFQERLKRLRTGFL